jgi:hypothetical protein
MNPKSNPETMEEAKQAFLKLMDAALAGRVTSELKERGEAASKFMKDHRDDEIRELQAKGFRI